MLLLMMKMTLFGLQQTCDDADRNYVRSDIYCVPCDHACHQTDSLYPPYLSLYGSGQLYDTPNSVAHDMSIVVWLCELLCIKW